MVSINLRLNRYLDRRVTVLLLLAASAVFYGCAKEENEDRAIRIQIDYYPEASHGGLYQAKLKGYFEDAGLDKPVEILPGGSGVYPMQQVALGKAEFGTGRLDDLLMAIERGLPLKAVVATYQRDPQGFMFHSGQAIESFEDLDGRRIMARPGAGFLTWIEQKYDISFELIPLNYDVAQFLSDEELVQQCYITSQPYYVEKAGFDVETLLLADTGFDPIRVLYVNTKFSDKHPEAVRDVSEAVLRGISDYLSADRAETDKLLLSLNPINVPELNDFTVDTMNHYSLAKGRIEDGESLGLIDPRRVEETIQVMIQVGMLENPIPYDAIVDASMH